MLGTIGGELLGGVIFAVYDSMTDVFFESGDVFEVVKGVFVEEILVQWPFLVEELVPLILPVMPVKLIGF